MNAICLSASNITHSGTEGSTSWHICRIIADVLHEDGVRSTLIDLRDYPLAPCTGCGHCYESRRCSNDAAFNEIYEHVIACDCVFIVSPHYAPIPAKLCMLLEKMEQITFLHWWKDNAYRAELSGIPTGIISHGGGSDWALESYHRMVNDTVANALATIQLKTIPFDTDGKAGISLPVREVKQGSGIFPLQQYDWERLTASVRSYVRIVLAAASLRQQAGPRHPTGS